MLIAELLRLFIQDLRSRLSVTVYIYARRVADILRVLWMAAAAAMSPTGDGYQGDVGLISWIDPAGIRIRSS